MTPVLGTNRLHSESAGLHQVVGFHLSICLQPFVERRLG